MLTVEKIIEEFDYVEQIMGTAEAYQSTQVFPGHGKFCDIYFQSADKNINQQQVAAYNAFLNTYEKYIPAIEQYFQDSLEEGEKNKSESIKKETLFFDVINMPFTPGGYDLVLICGKSIKQSIFFKKEIFVRVEFDHGEIVKLQRTKKAIDTLERQ